MQVHLDTLLDGLSFSTCPPPNTEHTPQLWDDNAKQGSLESNVDSECLLHFICFSSFCRIKAGGKQSSLPTVKCREKDVISLPVGMKAKSRSRLQGCLGANED